MNKIAIAFGGAILFMAGVCVMTIFGTAFGAIAGWVVGLFFGDTILNIAGQLGIHNTSMWQLGAFLGFVGGFMKTKTTTEVKAAKS